MFLTQTNFGRDDKRKDIPDGSISFLKIINNSVIYMLSCGFLDALQSKNIIHIKDPETYSDNLCITSQRT